MLISSRTRRASMSTLVKICFASLMAGWVIPDTNLASPAQPFQQQTTPTWDATADKQPDAPAKPHQPRPNPDTSGKYHVGDGVTAPRLIHSVEPEFSKKMRKSNSSGSCSVALTVDTDGNPKDAHIVKTTPDTKDEEPGDFVTEMQDICISTVRQYRFTPATYLGKPVPIDLKVEINFHRSAPRS
jgi:hypothetical protein